MVAGNYRVGMGPMRHITAPHMNNLPAMMVLANSPHTCLRTHASSVVHPRRQPPTNACAVYRCIGGGQPHNTWRHGTPPVYAWSP